MPTELERRARELFAAELARAELPFNAMAIANGDGDRFDECAIRAIAAALQAQQPDLTDEVIREGKAQWDRVAKILGADGDCVDSVIAAAERLAQQPGAQAVAWRYVRSPEEGCTEEVPGAWGNICEGHASVVQYYRSKGCRIEYAYPGQPPSIPEPDIDDLEAAWAALFASRGNMTNVLTTYTARLRERIGGRT